MKLISFIALLILLLTACAQAVSGAFLLADKISFQEYLKYCGPLDCLSLALWLLLCLQRPVTP